MVHGDPSVIEAAESASGRTTEATLAIECVLTAKGSFSGRISIRDSVATKGIAVHYRIAICVAVDECVGVGDVRVVVEDHGSVPPIKAPVGPAPTEAAEQTDLKSDT